MEQTAVEWLVKKYENYISKDSSVLLKDEIEQAKAMEKEQIKHAHSNGWNKGIQNNFISSQEYYNETFKSE